MDDRLARIGSVVHAGQPRDGRRGAARLMRCEAAELDRRDDAVARGPGALAPFDAGVVTREDEALLVGGQTLDRRSENPRDGEDPLGLDGLAIRFEQDAALLTARHDAGPEVHARLPQFVGHRHACLVAEERQRPALRSDEVTLTSS